MLQQATAITPSTAADPAYQAWSGSVRKVVMQRDPEARTAGPMPTFAKMVQETALAAQGGSLSAAQPYATTGTDTAAATAAASDEYTFDDVLDIINPLQHLPVIGTLYRKLSGDVMKPMSNIIGGAIFGGPIGAVGSTVNVIVKNRTGRDIAENAFALAGLDVTPSAKPKPDILYETALTPPPQEESATHLAADGRKSFAASRPRVFSYNV